MRKISIMKSEFIKVESKVSLSDIKEKNSKQLKTQIVIIIII